MWIFFYFLQQEREDATMSEKRHYILNMFNLVEEGYFPQKVQMIHLQ